MSNKLPGLGWNRKKPAKRESLLAFCKLVLKVDDLLAEAIQLIEVSDHKSPNVLSILLDARARALEVSDKEFKAVESGFQIFHSKTKPKK
jgi:hypothetical protein